MDMLRETIVNLARSFTGCPYVWGGAYPWPGPSKQHGGLDCSGFVIFVLRPFGLLAPKGDWTAHDLSKMFESTLDPQPADLVVYGTETHITHVAFFLGNARAISAFGDDPATERKEGSKPGKVAEHNAHWHNFIGYRNILKRRPH